MSGKTFVLMANAGSQNEFFASHICSKGQAELQRRDSRPTAMMSDTIKWRRGIATATTPLCLNAQAQRGRLSAPRNDA
jgi:hypothetical protein